MYCERYNKLKSIFCQETQSSKAIWGEILCKKAPRLQGDVFAAKMIVQHGDIELQRYSWQCYHAS